MIVTSKPSILLLKGLMRSDDATHYAKLGDGRIIVFKRETCDRCERACEGANPITFVSCTDLSVFEKAGLKYGNVCPELDVDDDGNAICPECRKAGPARDEAGGVFSNCRVCGQQYDEDAEDFRYHMTGNLAEDRMQDQDHRPVAPDENIQCECLECGHPYIRTPAGVNHHTNGEHGVDHDRDAHHVAYG